MCNFLANPSGYGPAGRSLRAILIAGRLNCGRSILNLFDFMKATESSVGSTL